MTRTLADMTPEERAECVGMWAERKHRLMVITAVSESARTADSCYPATASSGWDDWAELTPRFDLPRAWTPTGEPVPGDCEYAVGHVVEYADGQKDCRPRYREDSRQSALESAEGLKDDGYVAMCRYITDWEEA